MNVSQGDLARIVGHPQNTMAVVRVLHQLTESDPEWPYMHNPAWFCEALSAVVDGPEAIVPGKVFAASDRILRRLGDEGKEDAVVNSKELEWG